MIKILLRKIEINKKINKIEYDLNQNQEVGMLKMNQLKSQEADQRKKILVRDKIKKLYLIVKVQNYSIVKIKR
jgi:hypothetical protein